MEELKIIAEIMNGVTNGAMIVAITYLVLGFLKYPTIILTIGISISKVVQHFKVEKKCQD